MKERRKETRVREENRVVIHLPVALKSYARSEITAFSKDISVGGMRLCSDRPFSIGMELKLTVYLSRVKKSLKISGIVRWMTEHDGLYEIGLEFQHLLPSGIMTLMDHLYGKKAH